MSKAFDFSCCSFAFLEGREIVFVERNRQLYLKSTDTLVLTICSRAHLDSSTSSSTDDEVYSPRGQKGIKTYKEQNTIQIGHN
jgi:hypothetical protein